MTNWQEDLKGIYDERLFLIEKSFDNDLISVSEFKDFLSKGYEVVDIDRIEKSTKDTSELIKKEVYEKQLKPLIEQFLDENKELLKSLHLDLFGAYR